METADCKFFARVRDAAKGAPSTRAAVTTQPKIKPCGSLFTQRTPTARGLL